MDIGASGVLSLGCDGGMNTEPGDGRPRNTDGGAGQGRVEGTRAIGEANVLEVSSPREDQWPEMRWCLHSLKNNFLSTYCASRRYRDECGQETPYLESNAGDSTGLSSAEVKGQIKPEQQRGEGLPALPSRVWGIIITAAAAVLAVVLMHVGCLLCARCCAECSA